MTPTGTTSTTSHPCPGCGASVLCHCDDAPAIVLDTFEGETRADFTDWLLND